MHIYIYTVINAHAFRKLRLQVPIHTSSTAQGGGGSFKDRKPIGEVGYCEARMAE